MSQSDESDTIEVVLPRTKILKIQYRRSKENNCAVISFENFETGASGLPNCKSYLEHLKEVTDIDKLDNCMEINGAAGEVYMIYSKQFDHKGNRSFVRLKLRGESGGIDILGHRLIKLEDFNTEDGNDMRDDDTISSVSTRTDDGEKENFDPVSSLFTTTTEILYYESSILLYHCDRSSTSFRCNMMANYGGMGLMFENSGTCPSCGHKLVEKPHKRTFSFDRKNTSRTVFRPFD